MAMNDTAKNTMLDYLGTKITYVALCNASDVEISGGSPAYARKAVAWSASSVGSMSASGTVVFDVPACTVAKVKFYSAVTGGTLYGEYDVTDEVFASQGTYTVTSCSIDLNK